jgi:hypothetical protein
MPVAIAKLPDIDCVDLNMGGTTGKAKANAHAMRAKPATESALRYRRTARTAPSRTHSPDVPQEAGAARETPQVRARGRVHKASIFKLLTD